MGAPVSHCVLGTCKSVCVFLSVCASLNVVGGGVYLRVSACAYLGGSVTAHVCVRVFHVCGVYKNLDCVDVCPEDIGVVSVRVYLCFIRGLASVPISEHLDVVFCIRV